MFGSLFGRKKDQAVISRERVPHAGPVPVCSVPEFETALTRHYARANRAGRPFTVLIIHLDRLGSERRWAVADAAGERARVTDHVGWLVGTLTLGAILYNCNHAPTQEFAAGVLRKADVPEEDVETEIHPYPGPVPELLQPFLPEGPPER